MDGKTIIPPIVKTDDSLLGTLFILELQRTCVSVKEQPKALQFTFTLHKRTHTHTHANLDVNISY